MTVLHFGHTQILPSPPESFPTAVGCSRPLGVFLATVTHSEACASGPGAFDGGRLFDLFLATLTHFEPCASGPSAFDGGPLLQPPGLVFSDRYTL